MTKVLCFLVIAALAAQICARPDDKADAAAKLKAAAEATAKDKDKKTEDAAKALTTDKPAEVADDCDKAAEDAVKAVTHKPPPKKRHHPSIVSSVAKTIQHVVDEGFSLFEQLPFPF